MTKSAERQIIIKSEPIFPTQTFRFPLCTFFNAVDHKIFINDVTLSFFVLFLFVARKLFEFNLTFLRLSFTSYKPALIRIALIFHFTDLIFLLLTPFFRLAIINSGKGKWVNFNSLCPFSFGPFLRSATIENEDKLKRQWPAYLEFMMNRNFYRLRLLIRLLIYKC